MKQKSLLSRLFVTLLFIVGMVFALMPGDVLQAAPYASKVRISGTTVTFILNEPADLLIYRNGNGAYHTLDGSTAGIKTFSRNNTKDSFIIVAGKNSEIGYTTPTGGTIPVDINGLSQPSFESVFNLVSSDLNPLNQFNSLRSVSVSTSPNATNFGTAYIINSASGFASGGRALGDGLYALNADQTDAFGYGDTARDPGNFFDIYGDSGNSPYKLTAATNGEVYVADFSDANSGVYRARADLTSPHDGVQVLVDIGGPAMLPPGSTHGSAMSVYVEGSLATSNLVVYTTDEDLTTSPPDDRSSVWRYEINEGPLPSGVTPTRVNQSAIMVPLAVSDVNRGKDGKWYVTQNRTFGNEAGVFVLDTNGIVLFNSLVASRTLLGDSGAVDIFCNVKASAVSEDQKWLALMLNNNQIAILPLINGIPDIANRHVVSTGTTVISGRDLAFDAAGNLHYVSSGQGLYRVLAPGGRRWASTIYDGATYSFSLSLLPELEIARVGGQVRIDWPFGTLLESTNVAGPYNPSAVQESPYSFAPTGDMKFFRLTE